MARTPFTSARLKVQRASRHISEFQSFLKTVAKLDICSVWFESDENGTESVFVGAKPLPPDASLILGDFINCIRTGLDHMTSQIHLEITGRAKRTKFPIDESRDSLARTVSGSSVKKAFPDIENIIINKIDPTRDNKSPLWFANKLNNFDKHEQIVLVAGITKVHIEQITSPSGTARGNTFGIQNGRAHAFIGLPGPLKIEGKVTPTVDILFGPIFGLEGSHVFPFMVDTIQTTVDTINIIEAEYLK